MSRLTPLQKQFVVHSLARYSSLTEVCDQLKEQFGVTASTAQIARYKPGTIAGAGLSKPLNDLFDATRSNFLVDLAREPLFHLPYRLRRLDSMINKTLETNPRVALRALEQAAKECGGMYNRPQASNSATPEDINSNEAKAIRLIKLAFSKTREAETTELQRPLRAGLPRVAKQLRRRISDKPATSPKSRATSNNEQERAAPGVPQPAKLRIV